MGLCLVYDLVPGCGDCQCMLCFCCCCNCDYAGYFHAFLVNGGHDSMSPGKIFQCVMFQIQYFEGCTVNSAECLKCNISEYLVEEWPRPPLRS